MKPLKPTHITVLGFALALTAAFIVVPLVDSLLTAIITAVLFLLGLFLMELGKTQANDDED